MIAETRRAIVKFFKESGDLGRDGNKVRMTSISANVVAKVCSVVGGLLEDLQEEDRCRYVHKAGSRNVKGKRYLLTHKP